MVGNWDLKDISAVMVTWIAFCQGMFWLRLAIGYFCWKAIGIGYLAEGIGTGWNIGC